MQKLITGLLICLCLALSSRAAIIEFNPGPKDTSFFYNYYNFRGVLGDTPMLGQDFSLDFVFSDNKFFTAPKMDINFMIAQKPMEWPERFFSVKGFLFDSLGHKVSDLVIFDNTSNGPGFIVPDDAILFPEDAYYLLPDGKTKYVPAQTGYSAFFDSTPGDPLLFSGVHFDISAPVSPSDTILGVSLDFSNFRDFNEMTLEFENPIYISPMQLPYHSVPEPSVLLLTCAGFVIFTIIKKKTSKK